MRLSHMREPIADDLRYTDRWINTGQAARWGLVKVADWFDTTFVQHRVFRLCCLIADSQWWQGHDCTASGYGSQAGGMDQHDPDGER